MTVILAYGIAWTLMGAGILCLVYLVLDYATDQRWGGWGLGILIGALVTGANAFYLAALGLIGIAMAIAYGRERWSKRKEQVVWPQASL